MEPGIALFALGALVVLFPAKAVTLDPRDLWRRVEWADTQARR